MGRWGRVGTFFGSLADDHTHADHRPARSRENGHGPAQVSAGVLGGRRRSEAAIAAFTDGAVAAVPSLSRLGLLICQGPHVPEVKACIVNARQSANTTSVRAHDPRVR